MAMLTVLLFALCAGAAAADVTLTDVHTFADPSMEDTRINTLSVEGKMCLVLPSGMDLSAVPLGYTISDTGAAVAAKGAAAASPAPNGGTLNLLTLCGGEADCYEITLTMRSASSSGEQSLTFITTEHVGAMFLASDDPVNQGRIWVESSPDKSNKATGSMVMWDENGTAVYNGELAQIKGRGNSTWNGSKKPYQIKLADKTDLLQTGNSSNKAKTWVLLANYFDSTLLRNSVAFDLAAAMGMDIALEYTPISLYYDGEYRGAYILSEKVEVKDGRVEITDLEGANEDCNPDVDLEELPREQATTTNGATYIYCADMQTPEDITGGYLLEMDMVARAEAEACYFKTTRGQHVVVKSPEFCSKSEMEYIATLFQEFEDAVYSGGTNASTGKAYTDYVTLESIVQCYLVNELSKNPDGFHSSAYLYKEAGNDVMSMGPIWDYDLAFGIGTSGNAAVAHEPEGLFTLYTALGRALYSLSDFRMEVQRQYTDIVGPLVRDVLGGDFNAVSSDGSLHSMDYYINRIASSAANNGLLWHENAHYTQYQPGGDTWESNSAFLKTYLQDRNDWLLEEFGSWQADSYTPLGTFMDVLLDDWFYENVQLAHQYGLMNGNGGGLFNPLNITTRAHTAQVLYNLEKGGSVPYASVFSDVPDGKWYTTAILWAYDNDIVQGYPDGTYWPDKGVTRQDMLLLLYRHAGEPEVTGNSLSSYADASSVADYTRAAMQWALDNGIVEGYPDNMLRPKKTTTRAEFATLILRYYELTNN